MMATTPSRSPLSYRVGIILRSTFVLNNNYSAGVTLLVSKWVPYETYQYYWYSVYCLPGMRVNVMGNMRVKREEIFAVRGQGCHAGVWILVW